MGTKEEILTLLERNAKLTAAEVAVLIGSPVDEVEKTISELEKIKGHSGLWRAGQLGKNFRDTGYSID